jgi:hypothetical protein
MNRKAAPKLVFVVHPEELKQTDNPTDESEKAIVSYFHQAHVTTTTASQLQTSVFVE